MSMGLPCGSTIATLFDYQQPFSRSCASKPFFSQSKKNETKTARYNRPSLHSIYAKYMKVEDLQTWKRFKESDGILVKLMDHKVIFFGKVYI